MSWVVAVVGAKRWQGALSPTRRGSRKEKEGNLDDIDCSIVRVGESGSQPRF